MSLQSDALQAVVDRDMVAFNQVAEQMTLAERQRLAQQACVLADRLLHYDEGWRAAMGYPARNEE